MSWARWLLLGDLGQQIDIHEVRDQVERLRSERDTVEWDLSKLREVADELLELELRHGLLVRLLIRKGVISAAEYAELIAQSPVKPGSDAVT
jgi:hypothetical protein